MLLTLHIPAQYAVAYYILFTAFWTVFNLRVIQVNLHYFFDEALQTTILLIPSIKNTSLNYTYIKFPVFLNPLCQLLIKQF